jgi:hypothetical protein
MLCLVISGLVMFVQVMSGYVIKTAYNRLVQVR